MRKPRRTIGPALLLRGLTVDRRRPDLDSLARETDPERFVWKILPHTARSFAASIVVLPGEPARAAAVAYLYCRMLDTYEDFISDPAECTTELNRFADRFDSKTPDRDPGFERKGRARPGRHSVDLSLPAR